MLLLLLFFFFFLFLKHLFLNLQCCVGFCHKTMQISHNYVYPLPLVVSPLPSSHPSRPSQSARLGSPVPNSKFSPAVHLTPDMVYMLMLFTHLYHSLLPLCVHRPILYIFVSILMRVCGTFNCGLLTASEHFHSRVVQILAELIIRIKDLSNYKKF